MHINLSASADYFSLTPPPLPEGEGLLSLSPGGRGGRRPGEGATDPRRGLERFTISCSRARPRSSGKTRAGTKRPGRGWGGLPAWEGGHPGRHAGWKPALLQEERDALHSSVICSHDTICATRPGGDTRCFRGVFPQGARLRVAASLSPFFRLFPSFFDDFRHFFRKTSSLTRVKRGEMLYGNLLQGGRASHGKDGHAVMTSLLLPEPNLSI